MKANAEDATNKAKDVSETKRGANTAATVENLLRFEPKKAKKKKNWVIRQAAKLRLRHTIIAMAFVCVVSTPATLASLYLFFVASDQYHSTSSFSVRSIEATSGSDLLGMFTQTTASSTVSDSYVLLDFIRSEKMAALADEELSLERIYAQRGADFFFSLSEGEPIEEKHAYWQSMVDVNFDHTSGILNLTVTAFDPVESQKLAGFIVSKSEALINDLSKKTRDEVLRMSQDEVKMAEERLAAARFAVRNFRGALQEPDPVEGAKMVGQIIGALEQQLVQLQADLNTAENQMSADTPRVRVIKQRISSLERQIEQERRRFGRGGASEAATESSTTGGNLDVADRLFQFETLETEREFAERAYASSLASLEKARIDANARQRYLAVFVEPTLSQLAQYPSRILLSVVVLLGCLFIWAVGVMTFYNIRDRN